MPSQAEIIDSQLNCRVVENEALESIEYLSSLTKRSPMRIYTFVYLFNPGGV